VGKLLGLDQTLELLDRLERGVRRARASSEQGERKLEFELSRLQRQTDLALRGVQEHLASALAASEERRRAALADVQARRDRRKARLLQARQTAETRGLNAISSEEGRQVFHVQRELLQTARDRESRRQRTDTTLAVLQTDWDQERQAVEALARQAQKLFHSHRAFRRQVASPPATPSPSATTDSRQLLQACQTLVAQVEQDLKRFHQSLLLRLFGWLSPWLLSSLVIIGHGVVLALLPRQPPQLREVPWLPLAGSLAACLAGVATLHTMGRRWAKPAAESLARALAQAQNLLEAGEKAAWTEHAREHQRIENDTVARTDQLEGEWNRAVGEATRRRTELTARLGAKLARALARNDRMNRCALERGEQAHARETTRLRQEAEVEQNRLHQERSRQKTELEAACRASSQAMLADWTEITQRVDQAFAAGREAVARHFPAWPSEAWRDWTPPETFIPAAPFASITLDLEQLVGALPGDPRLALPGPSGLELPLLLTYPDHGSLLIETQAWGRPQALAALNNLVLRLLLNAPPGRALFTILDPVGLGASFAGLMHLTDHEDRLINRRIWTQPDHIEQRLAELNEHVEKVTQLYLRNEYATIADYNEQAGRIAEAYHFLVAADFPVNFSDVAAKRLLSLASSGPRCGVFLLWHWDRRKAPPAEFIPEDLRRACVRVTVAGETFVFGEAPWGNAPLRLDAPPEPDQVTRLLQQVGRSSVDSNRVEMPFREIAPAEANLWSLDTTAELRVPIGVTGATKLQYLALGKGTRQHALVAGKTGSGKSTLLHVLISNLALWCGPAAVEFYLVDFKKGVEFKCYAQHQLPHARVVAIESDREFGLSVLQRLDEELHRRGDLFRHAGVQDLPGYHRLGRVERLPRSLLIIDEFQEFFTEDDRLAQNSALLLDRLVRQGRAFGIHVILGSQTLGGAYTLTRTTLGQMVVRVALQCNEADAMLIMDDDNLAPRLLSRPGEAIYNDTAGALEGNSPFQVVWLPEDEREAWLDQINKRAAAAGLTHAPPVVFEGNAPADVRDNAVLRELLASPASQPPQAPRLFLGAPNSIKGPTEVVLRRQAGNHLLVIGQYEEPALAMLSLALVALAAQYPPGSARFVLLDATPPGTRDRALLEQVTAAVPQPLTWAGNANLDQALNLVASELAARADPQVAAVAPTLFLCIHHLERFKRLGFQDDLILTLDAPGAAPDPGCQLNRVLTEGAPLGIHVLCVCDAFASASRLLSRRALNEFDWRVLFQMSASDSASLMDSPRASSLGLHRAICYNAHDGTLETFRPYALPDQPWLESAGRELARLRG
jgi:DNA segregation ATPase FtsK/SpoIIIE-like protein